MAALVPLAPWLHIDWMLAVGLGWLAVGVAGVLAMHRLAFVAHLLFPLGGLLGLVLFVLTFAVNSVARAAVAGKAHA